MDRSADWMEQARVDLAHARSDIGADFYEWACFSAQQAAEKAIKAVFQRMGAEAWGHDLEGLLAELARSQPVSAELIDDAKELDKAYVPTRYPDAHPSGSPSSKYTRREAERLVGYAEGIVGFCEGLLPTLRPP